MTKSPWLFMPLLICFVILPRLSTDLYLPSLPNMLSVLHTSQASLQMTMTIFMMGYALSMLIAGPLSDIWGRKKVMTIGLAIFIFSSVVCIVSDSIDILLIGRFLQALGGCSGTVVARVMVKDAFMQEKQLEILTYLSAAMAICPVLVPIIGGLLQLYFGWKAAFYLLTVFAIFLFWLCQKQIEEKQFQPNFISLKTLCAHYKYLLTHPHFLGYSLVMGLVWCCYFAFTVEAPFLLQKILGFDSFRFGCLFSLTFIGYLIGTQAAKQYADQYGWDTSILIAIFLCLIATTAMAIFIAFWPLHWYEIVFPMMVMMIGIGIIIPCTQRAVTQPFPNLVGTVSGLFFFIEMLLGALGGFITRFFNANAALSLALFVLFVSIILFFCFYHFIWRQSERLLFFP